MNEAMNVNVYDWETTVHGICAISICSAAFLQGGGAEPSYISMLSLESSTMDSSAKAAVF